MDELKPHSIVITFFQPNELRLVVDARDVAHATELAHIIAEGRYRDYKVVHVYEFNQEADKKLQEAFDKETKRSLN